MRFDSPETPTGRRLKAEARPKLSHAHVFMLGWAYYAVVPLLIGHAMRFPAFEKIDVWNWGAYFDGDSQWAGALLLYVALVPVAFVVGSRVASVLRSGKSHAFRARLANGLLLPMYVALLLIFTFAARELLFGGYVEGVDSGVVGPLATLEMVFLFQYLFCKSAGLARQARLYGLLLLVTSLVLLSMGGRLYVMTALVGIYFHFWLWRAKDHASRRRSLYWIALIPVVMAAIGSWRLGETDLTGLLGFFLFAEPIYTAISGVSLFQGGTWSLLDTPRDFGSAFANIIPSMLWPEKASALVSLIDTDLQIESPFGAMSIIASTVGNFGFIGGLLFIAGVGVILGRARKNASTPIARALYCYLVSMLPFLFFRDPFQIQVKLVLTGFLLVGMHRLLASWRISRPIRSASSNS